MRCFKNRTQDRGDFWAKIVASNWGHILKIIPMNQSALSLTCRLSWIWLRELCWLQLTNYILSTIFSLEIPLFCFHAQVLQLKGNNLYCQVDNWFWKSTSYWVFPFFESLYCVCIFEDKKKIFYRKNSIFWLYLRMSLSLKIKTKKYENNMPNANIFKWFFFFQKLYSYYLIRLLIIEEKIKFFGRKNCTFW